MEAPQNFMPHRDEYLIKKLFYTLGKRCLRNSRGEGSYHGGGILELWLERDGEMVV